MPNWCSNSLHFQGNPQRIAEVAEQILIKTDKGVSIQLSAYCTHAGGADSS
ncbi:TPA: hypothetical protein ACE8FJ_000044 [Neisseria gonorrhoeae]